MRRTAIKRKRARYPSPAQERERREWGEKFGSCWICLQKTNKWIEWNLLTNDWTHQGVFALETHEIGSKAQSPGQWADKRNYFRVCPEHHAEILSWLPESVQLAFKKLHDPASYDRSFINEIRGRADTAISEGEVDAWCRFIKAIRV